MKSGITSSVVRVRALAAAALIIVSLQPTRAATNDLASTLQKGLFEEEANHNYSAAITAYESVVSRFDDNRKLAATAIFRIGEIYRKQGKTNEATAQYQRVINEFADQSALAALSRETLRNLGPANTTTAPNSIVASTTTLSTASAESVELAQIQNLIKNSPDLINAPDRNGQTLLQTAAAQGKLATVAMLLENGASVEANKSGDLTPLHFAAGNGHKAVVDLLLSKGAKAGAATSVGVTPLHLAVGRGYESVAKTLLDADAPPNAPLTRDANRGGEDLTYSFSRGYTPLHVAATSGYPGLIPLLVSKGADINALDDKGRSALSFVVATRLEPVVQALLKAKADPNAGTNCLPLHLAAYEGNTSMIEPLLAHGADPNKKSAVPFGSLPTRPPEGVLPLSLAVYQNQLEAAKALLKAKADPNDPSLQNQPLIFYALPQPEMLKALLEAGANPNVRPNANADYYASSPLESAVKDGRTEQVEMLLAHGADAKSAPRSGYSALHAAANIGSKPIAELLIKAGAPINAQDRDGATPLHKAVANRRLEVAQSLLDHKADPNLRDGNGKTPLDLAKELVRSDSSQPRPVPGPIGRPPTPIGQSQPAPAQPELLVNLLRQYGAVDDLPRLDRIEVRRPSANFAGIITLKSTNDWNQFTLVELVAMHYGLLSDRTGGNWNQNQNQPDNLFRGLAFPDFEHLVIDRPAQDGKSWAPASVNLLDLLNSGDCSHDQKLRWGDVVEIPEADHPVADRWPGLSEEAAQNLVKCVSRNVTVVAKGAKTQLTLAPSYQKTNIIVPGNKYYYNLIQASFMLRSVLDQHKLIRFSSDLTRVKVTRPASPGGKAQEWIFDCSDSNKSPAFWLRDGDTIEIPDKT